MDATTMDIIKWSYIFKFEGEKLEYCMGLIVEEEKIIVSYSKWDSTPTLAIYNKKSIENDDYEWILWVDSDIVINADVLQTLWASVDAKDRPVVSGTYFISKENERSLMTPFPALFNFVDDKPNLLAYLHPLPANALVKVDCAGFGFLLMHRSVGERMRVKHGKIPFFNETGVGDSFASEDINFFRLMHSAGVPLYAHTGAVVQHMKRFSFDLDFYKLFWNNNGKES